MLYARDITIAQAVEQECAKPCADELKDMAPVLPDADEVEPGAALHLTPSESMHPLGRIAAANSQLAAFTASLDAAKARPTVHALLACQACTSRTPFSCGGILLHVSLDNFRWAPCCVKCGHVLG